MLSQPWHKRVVCYRLEDKYGNCPYYYDGCRALLPCGYLFAYLNPARFKESDYLRYYHKLDMYEYLLIPSALTYSDGTVLFKSDQVISRTKIGR